MFARPPLPLQHLQPSAGTATTAPHNPRSYHSLSGGGSLRRKSSVLSPPSCRSSSPYTMSWTTVLVRRLPFLFLPVTLAFRRYNTDTTMMFSWKKISPRAANPDHGIPCSRSSHGLSVVDQGSRLILFGGEHVARTPLDPSQACWAVDGLNNDDDQPVWRRIDAPNPPPERVAHAQAADDEGNVYIFGGRAGIGMDEAAMNDLWVLKGAGGPPGQERWVAIEATNPPPEARSFHKMICLGDSLYVFGGCGQTSGRLADLHVFDLSTKTWTALSVSPLLRGRGGPSFFPIDSGRTLAVVAGFAGEETADGHRFDLESGLWDETLLEKELEPMRPRSVAVSASFPSLGVSLLFGGEVDPSDLGHEGAGGFEQDLILFNEENAHFRENPKKPPSSLEEDTCVADDDDDIWPESRGWSESAAFEDEDVGYMYIFGGLSGDDSNPKRLDDLWRLQIEKPPVEEKSETTS